jgi:RES domain-containing protein
MRLWRISEYADLSGQGGMIASGRWHSRGRPIIYAADHPAPAMLEMLVRFGLGTAVSPVRFQLIAMDVDDAASIQRLSEADLDPAWKTRTADTRAIGDAWLESVASLMLVVPSALVPRADNVLINPVHPDISRAAVVETMRVTLDERLLRS